MARMQGHDNRLGVAAGKFDGACVDELVQRRLGRAVGIPAPQGVVADGSDPRRQGGKAGGAGFGQQADCVFQNQCRAHGVQAKLVQHGVCIQPAQGFLWPLTV